MISYNKTFNQNVLDNLRLLIAQEFRNIPIRYDSVYRGNSFFHLTPRRDEIIELRSDGAIREYSILITYNEKERGRYVKNRSLDSRISIVERLKEIIRSNVASIDDFLYFVDSGGNNFLTSDSEELRILKRPILITSTDQFFITSDDKAFTVFPADFSYEWHNARLQSVNYDLERENANYLSASMEFLCVVEEVYA
tara:strand:- start:6977 stop:7564 length:588 start_codon:yes stop_codon:yes gene_type:complete